MLEWKLRYKMTLSKAEKKFLVDLRYKGKMRKYEIIRYWATSEYAQKKLERLHQMGLVILHKEEILPHDNRIKEEIKNG